MSSRGILSLAAQMPQDTYYTTGWSVPYDFWWTPWEHEMRPVLSRLAFACVDLYHARRDARDIHRKCWEDVMDQIEEVALRPSDPDSEIPLLKRGGALYCEMVSKYNCYGELLYF